MNSEDERHVKVEISATGTLWQVEISTWSGYLPCSVSEARTLLAKLTEALAAFDATRSER
jgi:hypothetical protein